MIAACNQHEYLGKGLRRIRDQYELILQGIDDAGRQWCSEKVCEQQSESGRQVLIGNVHFNECHLRYV